MEELFFSEPDIFIVDGGSGVLQHFFKLGTLLALHNNSVVAKIALRAQKLRYYSLNISTGVFLRLGIVYHTAQKLRILVS